jgi:hypothetical protein
MRRRHHNENEDDPVRKERRQLSDAGDYTTVGAGDSWYGHPGGPTGRDRDQSRQHGTATKRERPPFDTEREPRDNAPDWHEQDRGTADYAYGSYGHREPGHARSDPYPPEPHEPD